MYRDGGILMKKIIVGIDGSKESFDSYKCVPGFFPELFIVTGHVVPEVLVRDHPGPAHGHAVP